MKKYVLIFVALLGISTSASAYDIKDILGAVAGSQSDNGTIGNIISNVLSTDKVEPESLTGTWNYAGPAISFQSENLLQKAGGAAAAGTIEEKLAPYYKVIGFDKLVLTVNDDQTFEMKLKRGVLKGTITKEDDNIYFNFQALGKVNIGKMKTYVTMTGKSSMNIMFDVTKLISIVKAAGSVTGNATIKGVSSLLESYDGICAGFKLTK